MTPQPSTKPRKRKPASLADLIDRLDRQAVAIDQLVRSVKLLANENQRLVDVLLQDAGVIDEDEEPQTYMDGTRIS